MRPGTCPAARRGYERGGDTEGGGDGRKGGKLQEEEIRQDSEVLALLCLRATIL